MDRLLKFGDVINLIAGTEVYANIPSKYVYMNQPLSNELTNTKIKLGEVVNTVGLGGCIDDIVNDIIHAFKFRSGLEVNAPYINEFVNKVVNDSDIKNDKIDTSQYVGDYMVIDTSLDGGGTGHGYYDIYPDGHHVYCQKMKDGQYDPNGFKIDFFQTGSFNVMIAPERVNYIKSMEIVKTVKYVDKI